jgi:hypothetical protein
MTNGFDSGQCSQRHSGYLVHSMGRCRRTDLPHHVDAEAERQPA